MARSRKTASPVLGAAMSAIGDAAETLVSSSSRFRHSMEVPVADIRADPEQPRKRFDAAELRALGATLQAEGQLQPVLLRRDPARRGQWILVAGERRWRAAQAIGWSSLLAIEHQGDADVAALLENLQRVDLSPVEEAQGVRRLVTQKGFSQARIAALLGRSAAEISATMRLLSLPEAFLSQAAAVPRNVLVELARVPEGPARNRLMQQALAGSLTVRAIRGALQPQPSRPEAARLPSPAFPTAALQGALARLEQWQRRDGAMSPKQRALLVQLQERIASQLAI
jgi:ParB family chromosome partitioning protein